MPQVQRDFEITHDLVKEMFSYDPDTGVMTRQKSIGNARAGDVVGTPTDSGHLVCRCFYKIYYVHRLAWLYMTGSMPKEQVDHINGTPGDNRWQNLREASAKENRWNAGLPKNNKSGVVGVQWYKEYGRWRAVISANGKEHFLGYFEDFNEAVSARRKAQREIFGKFSRAA